ncbi:hypothetical protein DXH95_13160 [Sphingorhabdus pulchriflava]|uniref:Lipoprotein n=1 Tax=Sphingorhabdus pulchriflava TaxID=2292257 RepID=A0A371B640_9SPHN|nr:DUF6491 family protein [Sphingorhabdus pulchriflava]RDV02871.1 hypothetical protein DXH95_13160 [Sphingorhabdus pulchriflava]
MLRKGMVFAVTATIALAGCAYGDADSAPAPIRDKEAKILAKELKGKVAGEPRSCINSRGVDAIRISDDILLYRESGRLVYQNKLRGPCPGLTRGDDIMVTESFSGQLCSGDLIRLVDRTSGIQGPVCSLGNFVPYKKAK